MALPKAGQQISFADLRNHFGIAGAVSLNDPKIQTARNRSSSTAQVALTDLTDVPNYRLPRSLRFNDAKGQYLYRTTPGTAWAGNPLTSPNPYKYTISCWVKQLAYVGNNYFMSAYNAVSNYDLWGFDVNGALDLYCYVSAVIRWRIITNKRWPLNQWNHVVFAYDVGNADVNERIKLWVNGVKIQAADCSTYTLPTQNNNGYMNNAGATIYQYIGIYGSTPYANMKIADHIVLDGTVLDCNAFGEFNSKGQWVAKEPNLPASYYGYSGWRLNFANPESITSLMTTHTAERPGDGRQAVAYQWRMYGYTDAAMDTSITSSVDIPSYGGEITPN